MRPNEWGAFYMLAPLMEMHSASNRGIDPIRGSNKTTLLPQGIVYETENTINSFGSLLAASAPSLKTNHENQNQEPQGGARTGILPTSEFQNDS